MNVSQHLWIGARLGERRHISSPNIGDDEYQLTFEGLTSREEGTRGLCRKTEGYREPDSFDNKINLLPRI